MANTTNSPRGGNQKGTRETFGQIRVFYRHNGKRISERAFKALPAKDRNRVKPTARYYATYTLYGQTYTPGRAFTAQIDASGWLAGEKRLVDLDLWTPPTERAQKAVAAHTTVSQLFEKWLPLGERKATTQITYRSLYKNRVEAYLAERPVAEVTEEEIEEWFKKIKADFPTTTSRNASAYTLVATLFRYAVKEKMITTTPCAIEKATQKPDPEVKELLTDEEFSQLIEALPERYRLAVVVAEHCQLRISEWTELRRKDLSVRKVNGEDQFTLSIARRVAWVDNKPDYSTPKSRRGLRRVSLSPVVGKALQEYMAEFSPSGAEGLLFVNERGNQIRHTRFREMLAHHSMKLFNRRVGSHEFRHRGATEFARAGATLKDLMSRLGHSTPEMALVYQHNSDDRDRRLAEQIPIPWLPEERETND